MFISVDIWGTYNTFIPLPTCRTTCSLSLERKRSALCQCPVGFTWCMWVIRCLLKMSLAAKHRAGKLHLYSLDFTGARVWASRRDEWWTWHLCSEKENERQLLVFWWSILWEVLTQNLKNDRWESENEWETNRNWYKFFHAGLGRLMAEIICFLKQD